MQGRQSEICTKPSTCPVCGIHHLAIVTQGQQVKTGRITFFYNWEKNSRQNKTTKKKTTPKHAIILDVQFKTKNIFSRMWYLKLLKYGCHQQQLQEARTSAEQIISTYTARRKRGTFHTKFSMVATACQAWRKTWQKQAQIQFSRSSFYCLSLFFFTQVRISVLFFPSTVIKLENPCEGRVLSSRNQAETFTFKIRMQWFFFC